MRIALLWNESIVRDALANFLESRGRFDIVVVTDQAKDCLEAVRQHNVHVVVAEANLLTSAQRQFLLGAKLLGSFGLLFVSADKTTDGLEGEDSISFAVKKEDFFDRIRECGSHIPDVTPGRRKRRSDKPHGLSAREFDIATLISKGYSNRRISEETGIQEQSVKNSVSAILRKMDCENRTQLALRMSA